MLITTRTRTSSNFTNGSCTAARKIYKRVYYRNVEVKCRARAVSHSKNQPSVLISGNHLNYKLIVAPTFKKMCGGLLSTANYVGVGHCLRNTLLF